MSSAADPAFDDYQYQPLDHATQQIRLVTLLDPLVNEDAIRLEIKVFEISEAPPYTALSYVWGPSSSNDTYIANGRLEIRDNLFKFLTEFRKCSDKTPSDQYLWIDQLCIDQSNNVERNHQVQMMSDIYSKATSVIAWLGDGSQKADPSSSVAAHGCNEFKNTYDAACVWKDAGDPVALAYILHNEYFRRVWIVQEFILARQIRVLVKGVWLANDARGWECRFETLDHFLRRSVGDSTYNIICESALRRTGEFIHLDIGAALDRYERNDCADPHDKVYGLLGLIRLDQRVEVDYDKSIDQLFMDVVLIVLQSQHQCLEPLEEEADPETFFMFMRIAAAVRPICRWDSFTLRFLKVLHSNRLGRFHNHACPITAIGHETAAETGCEEDRFWFDFQGTRHSIYCANDKIRMADGTERLFNEDWEKYVPRDHADETS